MKNICALFCLDNETNMKVQSYRDKLTKYNIPFGRLNVHITIANFMDIEPIQIIEYSKEFMKKVKPFTIKYKFIEILSDNCLACIPETSGELLKYYNQYHNKYDEYCDKWTMKENKLWFPHSTIYSETGADYFTMKEEIEKSFTPFEGKIVGFELSQINEDNFEIIYSSNLSEI